jgi:hypothetical protein
MSSPSAFRRATALPESLDRDQRSHTRYPIVLDAKYKVLDRSQFTPPGTGKTLNISTSGVLLECDGSLPPGSTIEVFIQWPYLLDDIYPLTLILSGHTVRSLGRVVAIETNHYEFHAARRAPRAWLVRRSPTQEYR